jgi:predicted nucleic acid-binding protein
VSPPFFLDTKRVALRLPAARSAFRGRALCAPPRLLTLATHEAGITIAERTGYRLYDALIIATALEAGCDTLLSEDLHDGQVIDGRLTIRNPFRSIA